MKCPILITGSHRSGTTWVGRILNASPNTHFVGEPFNPVHAKHCPYVPIKHWFHAVMPDEENIFQLYLSHKVGRAYHPLFLTTQLASENVFYNHMKGYTKCLLYHLRNYQPIVKDPIALFSATWFFNHFQSKVVILIRHPAAFVSSLKRANWAFPFEHFLQQPQLMEERLSSFQEDIDVYAKNPPDLIDQGILLWRIFHHTIAHYQLQQPDWIFVRHEDLSRSPLLQFELLFRQLNLPFTSCVKKQIADYNIPKVLEQEKHSHHQLYRDSRTNIWAWRSHLSPIEIDRIRVGVADISPQFYGDEDWIPERYDV
ncbi:sulfotransferase [Vacuolonema iberomarrocanum]|uniref:sulfotransferase n=1 Tax=Vacuolonema iberomarrocanum TaxID=3454632 RepID=UPI0019EB644C|nr:sulfotransferase [filamentous cyanobacterium LEGE 07170]